MSDLVTDLKTIMERVGNLRRDLQLAEAEAERIEGEIRKRLNYPVTVVPVQRASTGIRLAPYIQRAVDIVTAAEGQPVSVVQVAAGIGKADHDAQVALHRGIRDGAAIVKCGKGLYRAVLPEGDK